MLYTAKEKRKASFRGGSETQFPGKLHDMMTYVEHQGLMYIISWIRNGRAFMVHDPEKLLEILPTFFGQTKYRSFQRQLNMWHFQRILDGPDKGAFVHPFFVRGNKLLCGRMSRHVPPNQALAASLPDLVNDPSIERVDISNWSLRHIEASIMPLEKSDISSASYSVPDSAMTSCSQTDFLASKPGVDHSIETTSDSLRSIFLNKTNDASCQVTSIQQDPIAGFFMLDPLEAACPGMSIPASPETVESIFKELRGFK
jgi:hypothetical protein